MPVISEIFIDAASISLPGNLSATQPAKPSIEDEVIDLFDETRGRLLRYLLSFGLPVADGEEVIQETFLALFRHLQQGKSRRNLRGWLFRVAHNLALKKRQRSRREYLTDDSAAEGHSIEDPGPNPEVQFATNQTMNCVQSVVRALPELDRQCLALRAEGLRYREIAKALEISLGAVSMSLGKSLARIARATGR